MAGADDGPTAQSEAQTFLQNPCAAAEELGEWGMPCPSWSEADPFQPGWLANGDAVRPGHG
eukprot:CAMPEP_0113707828 /NCGR_PEP_ID=MMETSP0038_2-20120614/28627_1 /TAXON_ID=2898 /ORGANISM="Cryptomonas paramecium" /LENGTH=60 /DNA_ID=CAMNT_0000633435 /DNA_START=664 /DNA_END=843 /DNA_ORIENTATION=+ /assembly_acc=CAM_ASM_000170